MRNYRARVIRKTAEMFDKPYRMMKRLFKFERSLRAGRSKVGTIDNVPANTNNSKFMGFRVSANKSPDFPYARDKHDAVPLTN